MIDSGIAAKRIIEYISAVDIIFECLRVAEARKLPDWFIVGGVIRDAVWSLLDGRSINDSINDIDLIYFDAEETSWQKDLDIEGSLNSIDGVPWSVKNQARMHLRNNDAPYMSVPGALYCAPDTISTISITKSGNSDIIINSCFGYEDLGSRIFRPTPYFMKKYNFSEYILRVKEKNWINKWPESRIIPW